MGRTRALDRALALHDRAVAMVGAPPPHLASLQVLTESELDNPAEVAAVSPPWTGVECVLTNDLYWATRAMHRATTGSELTDILVGFVVAVGGEVRRNWPSDRPDQISVDMTLEDGERLFAVADEISVPGLIIEHSLPDLVANARAVLARSKRHPRATRLTS